MTHKCQLDILKFRLVDIQVNGLYRDRKLGGGWLMFQEMSIQGDSLSQITTVC